MTRRRSLPEALEEYRREDTARFHMPGHKGRGMGGFFCGAGQGWDVTEIAGTDNLHSPSGPIAYAEERMAEAMGAGASLILVNGATAGVHAMCASAAGGRMLLARDAHRSAAAGCAIFGVDAVPFSFPGAVTAEAVSAAMGAERYDAVLITSPDYYGFCADIPAIAAVAHERGARLFVDAAHGAHFPFSDSLPASPAGYADAWVVSLHKTLNALTQTAVLNLADTGAAADLRRTLALIETSSPSYLLMASADWARHTAVGAWDAHAARIHALRQRLAAVDGVRALDMRDARLRGAADIDITRLALDVTGRGLTGFEAAAAMRPAGIVAEMADERRVVLITTPADPDEWYARLLAALASLPRGGRVVADAPAVAPGARVTTVREAVFGSTEAVPLAAAAGRVAAGACGVYPPGTALLFPGELITETAIGELLRLSSLGAELFGVSGGLVRCLKT